jgi:hypothetical protein
LKPEQIQAMRLRAPRTACCSRTASQ